ncbi:MAG: AI-2E family transporter [Chloroflexi bacterium]|nr:AI-2E family transporter [Chloroflexota bacterium]MBK7915088.1 AI-2E family transporter [Chloroflexota bacterium]MBK8935725.1 AI-2E family transporter [Chloroflexota bacterium]MBP6804935.1 AI-2E family transporter [Chloroflexota bacterium]MBP7592918.1 AI-2E family transporter [Chloroflexota bacterium]
MEQTDSAVRGNSSGEREARLAWKKLGTAVRSTTPTSLLRGLLVLGAITAVLWLGWSTWPALLPFLIGGAIAYALLPFTNWLNKFMPRALAVTISLLTMLLLIGLVLYASVTTLGRQAFLLYQTVPTQVQINEAIDQLDQQLTTLPTPMQNTIQQLLTRVSTQVRFNAEAYNERIVDLIYTGLLNLFNTLGFILGFLAVPAWLLLVLKDQQAGARALQRLLPDSWLPDLLAVWRIFDRSFRAFVEGLLVLALFVTLFVYIGLILLENLGALSTTFKLGAALFAGMMQLIPTVGPIIVVLVILLTRLTIFSTAEVLILLGLYLVVEQMLRLTAEPRVRKQITPSIHPALLIMVIVALSEFGFLWVLLAGPITAVIRDLFLYGYGRLSSPPRPAGLLPGEPLPKTRKTRPSKDNPPPTSVVYRHGRAARQTDQHINSDTQN